MDFELVVVSKYASEVITRHQIGFPNLQQLMYFDLLLKIHQLYPTLYLYGDPRVYWQYARNRFFRIEKYFTFISMILFMADKKVYLLLEDCEPNGEETESFLRWLDYLEERAEEKKRLTKYDVLLHKCKRRKPPKFDYVPRTDEEILAYALRKVPHVECYTCDTYLETKAAEYIRRGMPKRQKLRKMYVDEVIERILPKASKKGKKDKGKKDKKKK
ncbi:uncharacterized protein LOC108739402 [Agrilus planipennis]|uniref:Uncharacterized protein LOC108739402 n=1 Tax=Agrilus planipennis TaxID=224129 RepID=A0A1W4WY63_AGRPL|nr:uncharacterized protein LOC108739402 [Agrilus planipennis]